MDGGPWWSAVHGIAKSRMTERLHFHFSLSCIGEGNGNPLQCSCLENPRDGGAWWAAVYGVAQSRTRLKQLSSNSSSVSDGKAGTYILLLGKASIWRVNLYFKTFPRKKLQVWMAFGMNSTKH